MRHPTRAHAGRLSAAAPHRAARLLAAAGLSAALVGCANPFQRQTPLPVASPSPAAESDPFARRPRPRVAGDASAVALRVGAVLSLSGAGAALGAAQRNGITMAIDEINQSGLLGSVRLRPTIVDDASDRTQAQSAFERLINQDHVLAILGPTSSAIALAVDPLAQQAAVPVLAISNTAGGVTEIGEFIFRDSLTDEQVVPQSVRAAKDRFNVKRAAILYDQDDVVTRTTDKAFKKTSQQQGIKIVAEQGFSSDDRSFVPQLRAVVAARPDAVFLAAFGEQASALLSRLRQSNIASAAVVGGSAFNSPAVLRAAGPAAEGLVVGAGWNAASPAPRSREFVSRYQQRFNAQPDQLAAQAYAGIYILAEGFRLSGMTRDSRALRDGLAQVKNLDTVLGAFSFTPDRNADHPAVIQVVKDGTLVPLVP